MAAELSVGESSAFAESMKSSLRDPGPIDPYPVGLWLFTLDSFNPRERSGAFDFEAYSSVLKALSSAIPLLRLEMRSASLVKRQWPGRFRGTARSPPASALSSPFRRLLVHRFGSDTTSWPDRLCGLEARLSGTVTRVFNRNTLREADPIRLTADEPSPDLFECHDLCLYQSFELSWQVTAAVEVPVFDELHQFAYGIDIFRGRQGP